MPVWAVSLIVVLWFVATWYVCERIALRGRHRHRYGRRRRQ